MLKTKQLPKIERNIKTDKKIAKHRFIPEQTQTTDSFTQKWNPGQTWVPHWRLSPVCSTPVTWAALHREVQGKAGIEELALSMEMGHPTVSSCKAWEPEGPLPVHTTSVTAT